MNPIQLIEKYYHPSSLAYQILVVHSKMVTQQALKLAEKVDYLNPDRQFIQEAAMLHDIGIYLTNAPGIDCHGKEPYIAHGILGRKILEKEGLPRHALICERHIGTGLTREDIIQQQLPLPQRDMLPISLEEKIICFADNFFSKNKNKLREKKSLNRIRKQLAQYSTQKLKILEEWIVFFKL